MTSLRTFLILTTLIVTMTGSTAWAGKHGTVFVSHPKAKIRSGPATTYDVLWRPRLYTPLEVLAPFIDEKGQKWFAVRDVEGDIGWIYHSTVTKGRGAIVTTEYLNIRSGASTTSKVLYQAPHHFTFKVLKESGGWMYVLDPDKDKGWIFSKNVWMGDTPMPKKGPIKH